MNSRQSYPNCDVANDWRGSPLMLARNTSILHTLHLTSLSLSHHMQDVLRFACIAMLPDRETCLPQSAHSSHIPKRSELAAHVEHAINLQPELLSLELDLRQEAVELFPAFFALFVGVDDELCIASRAQRSDKSA